MMLAENLVLNLIEYIKSQVTFCTSSLAIGAMIQHMSISYCNESKCSIVIIRVKTIQSFIVNVMIQSNFLSVEYL